MVAVLQTASGATAYTTAQLPKAVVGVFSITAAEGDAARIWPAGLLRVET